MSPRRKLDRDTVLSGRPEQAPAVRREERPNGGVKVTFRRVRRRWLGWFGGESEVERSFGLDVLGREVYEFCDGKSDVGAIVRKFANKHRVSRAEAELAVTTFLKTMMTKGLIVMAIDKDRVQRKRN